jgi:hypothetical protein
MVMSDFVDGESEVIEYVLEATLEIGLGGVGGGSLAGTAGGGSLLKERRDTLELYPLSALARGLGARYPEPFTPLLESCVALDSVRYPESREVRTWNSDTSGVPGSGSKSSSSTAMCLLVASNCGEEGGELSNEKGLRARSS